MKCFVKGNEILYIDNHILVVNKKGGLLTQPTETGEENLEEILKEWIKQNFKKEGNVFLHTLHRLDKPVEGIVIFARSSKALSRLNEELRGGKIQKKYIAEIEGHVKEKEKTLQHALVHKDFKAVVDENDKEAKMASLTYRVKEERKETSILEITLHTGRYHQIRCQMGKIKHPILKDRKYGSKLDAKQIHLTHATCSFMHPTLKKEMHFSITPSWL